MLEIKNGNGNGEAFSEETNLEHIGLPSSKELYIMLFNNHINIPTTSIGSSWSFILSVKPNNILGAILRNEITISLRLSSGSQNSSKFIKLRIPFDGTKVNFEYSTAVGLNPLSIFKSFYPIHSPHLIHISIGCESKTISLRINGKPWCDYKVNFNHELTKVMINAPVQIGILSTTDS